MNEKGILNPDPESRTRILDANTEGYLLKYSDGIDSAFEEAEQGGAGWTLDWIKGLKKAVDQDWDEVYDEWIVAIEEERKKRGLTGHATYFAWLRSRHPKPN